jgi:hypothetical protein
MGRPAKRIGREIWASFGPELLSEDNMTQSDDEMEELLRGLPRRGPSAGLDRRIAGSLAPRRVGPGVRVAVAASIAVVVGFMTMMMTWSPKYRPVAVHSAAGKTTTASVATSDESPVELETTVSNTIDDGIVAEEDGVPYRQVRRETVREYWWVNPASGARVRMRVPSEQVIVSAEETF